MNNLVAIWQGLTLRQRSALIGATALAVALVVVIAQMAARPAMKLLYAGLDPVAAGEMVASLEQMGVEHQVQGNAIYVPAAERDRLRLALAREGLPRQGQAGYELLDGMSGFSATSDMFDAAYWRAKEGELARTILASPRVRSARVHIATPPRRAFSRKRADPSATVTVAMAGASATREEATAFRYLVALSVPGLAPEHVAVIDSRAGLVLTPGAEDPVSAAGDLAARREAHLKSEIESLLAARVGPGKSRVSVAVETDPVGETVSEKVLQPDSRVVIHSETTESNETSKGSDGAVTVASNLPEGDAGGQNRESAQNETRERVNFDYSEVRRERVRRPGAISRISVAVLVDGISVPGANGQPTWQPRPADELDALRKLVVAAIGYDEERGDVVTVESMAFQPAADPSMPETGLVERLAERYAGQLGQMLVLAMVVIVLALTVIRPMLTAGRAPMQEILPPPEDDAAPEGPAAELAGPLDESVFNLPDRETLRTAVTEFQEQSIATLRDWLEGSEDEAA